MKINLYIILFVIASFAVSCKKEKTKSFDIGVSLCNDDLWHQSVISEMKHEKQFYEDVLLDIQSNRNGDDEEQIRIIESFINQKKDLLVISAGNASVITSVVEKAHKAQIPIIILDQRIDSDIYTAYVGGDNYRIGAEAALYIANMLKRKGNVVELRGRTESLTDTERHRGFIDTLSNYPEIEIVAEQRANFNTVLAEQRMLDIIRSEKDIDVIFAMDDLTAKGVYNAYQKAGLKQPFTIGVDALVGENGGMDNISKGFQDISFIYPTGADKVLEVAHKILLNEPFERENILYTGIVDKSNVDLMLKQKEYLFLEQQKAGMINTKLSKAKDEYSVQQFFLYASICVISIIAILLLFSIRAYQKKHKGVIKLREQHKLIEEEHAKAILRNSEIQKQLDVLYQPQTEIGKLSEEQIYIAKFRDYVTEHITDSSLDVERLAEIFNESYTQMYRKIKSTTGYTPVEFVRLIRLTYAKQLLNSTSKNISAVAYESGFSSPSYFTRCFKEYYKESPKEFLNKSIAND